MFSWNSKLKKGEKTFYEDLMYTHSVNGDLRYHSKVYELREIWNTQNSPDPH